MLACLLAFLLAWPSAATQTRTRARVRMCVCRRPCQAAQRPCQVQLESVWPDQFQLVLDAVAGQRCMLPAAACSLRYCAYAMPSKEELAELWLHAQPGRLSAKEQLRAMALRDTPSAQVPCLQCYRCSSVRLGIAVAHVASAPPLPPPSPPPRPL